MKTILGLSRVKNEQDIIESFVRHNIQFLDHLVVVDNTSLDDTLSILEALQKEFSNLIILVDNEIGFNQSEIMTRLYRLFQNKYRADYIIPLDADEFLYQIGVEFSKTTLLDALESIIPGSYGLIPWKTFVHFPHFHIDGSDFPRNMTWKRVVENPQYYKVVFRHDGKLDTEIIFELGNHNIKSYGPKMPVMLSNVCLLHYPVRSVEQLISKSIFGCLAYVTMKNYVKGGSYQWFVVLDKIRSERIDQIDLCRESFLYAQAEKDIDWNKDVECFQPLFNYARKYSHGSSVGPLALIARSIFHQIPPDSEKLGWIVRVKLVSGWSFATKFLASLLSSR